MHFFSGIYGSHIGLSISACAKWAWKLYLALVTIRTCLLEAVIQFCGAAGTASFNCKQTAAKDFGWGANEALNSASLAVVANNEWLLIATSGCERVVAKCNEWLLIAMSGCEQRVVADTARGRVFWKLVHVLLSRPGNEKGTIESLYTCAIFKPTLYIFATDPIKYKYNTNLFRVECGACGSLVEKGVCSYVGCNAPPSNIIR